MRIKFVGKKSGQTPLHTFTDGNTVIILPPNQSRGFFHQHAAAILRHAPDRYKKIVPKAKNKK